MEILIIMKFNEKPTVPDPLIKHFGIQCLDLNCGCEHKTLSDFLSHTIIFRAQTLRALRENSGNHLSYAQYGSLASLCILGPEVLQVPFLSCRFRTRLM